MRTQKQFKKTGKKGQIERDRTYTQQRKTKRTHALKWRCPYDTYNWTCMLCSIKTPLVLMRSFSTTYLCHFQQFSLSSQVFLSTYFSWLNNVFICYFFYVSMHANCDSVLEVVWPNATLNKFVFHSTTYLSLSYYCKWQNFANCSANRQ